MDMIAAHLEKKMGASSYDNIKDPKQNLEEGEETRSR
jgi:hypothetical protein